MWTGKHRIFSFLRRGPVSEEDKGRGIGEGSESCGVANTEFSVS